MSLRVSLLILPLVYFVGVMVSGCSHNQNHTDEAHQEAVTGEKHDEAHHCSSCEDSAKADAMKGDKSGHNCESAECKAGTCKMCAKGDCKKCKGGKCNLKKENSSTCTEQLKKDGKCSDNFKK